MQEKLIITLPEEIKTALDDVTRKEGVSPSDVIGEAVKEYLFFRRFRPLRERMIPKAREQGIYTDQDVFTRV
ncbi:MAG: hypothetical protein ACPLRM_04025, partial [Anaerolineae bacterium]